MNQGAERMEWKWNKFSLKYNGNSSCCCLLFLSIHSFIHSYIAMPMFQRQSISLSYANPSNWCSYPKTHSFRFRLLYSGTVRWESIRSIMSSLLWSTFLRVDYMPIISLTHIDFTLSGSNCIDWMEYITL